MHQIRTPPIECIEYDIRIQLLTQQNIHHFFIIKGHKKALEIPQELKNEGYRSCLNPPPSSSNSWKNAANTPIFCAKPQNTILKPTLLGSHVPN